MSEAMGGFFRPEQTAAKEKHGVDATREDVSTAILQLLATQGPLTVRDLIQKISTPARSVTRAVDDLESLRRVRLSAGDADEYVEITQSGRASLDM